MFMNEKTLKTFRTCLFKHKSKINPGNLGDFLMVDRHQLYNAVILRLALTYQLKPMSLLSWF